MSIKYESICKILYALLWQLKLRISYRTEMPLWYTEWREQQMLVWRNSAFCFVHRYQWYAVFLSVYTCNIINMHIFVISQESYRPITWAITNLQAPNRIHGNRWTQTDVSSWQQNVKVRKGNKANRDITPDIFNMV